MQNVLLLIPIYEAGTFIQANSMPEKVKELQELRQGNLQNVAKKIQEGCLK